MEQIITINRRNGCNLVINGDIFLKIRGKRNSYNKKKVENVIKIGNRYIINYSSNDTYSAVKMIFTAPQDIKIYREEIYNKMEKEQ